jgi:hypothetical protein
MSTGATAGIAVSAFLAVVAAVVVLMVRRSRSKRQDARKRVVKAAKLEEEEFFESYDNSERSVGGLSSPTAAAAVNPIAGSYTARSGMSGADSLYTDGAIVSDTTVVAVGGGVMLEGGSLRE